MRYLLRVALSVTTALATVALSAGCGSPASPPTEAPGPERVVSDSTGEVRIPADVERIVTVHHIATQPLTDLGVVPVGRDAITEGEVTNLDVVRSGKVYPGGKDTVGGFEDANYNLALLDATLTTIAAGA